jgi:hypothetical protein
LSTIHPDLSIAAEARRATRPLPRRRGDPRADETPCSRRHPLIAQTAYELFADGPVAAAWQEFRQRNLSREGEAALT